MGGGIFRAPEVGPWKWAMALHKATTSRAAFSTGIPSFCITVSCVAYSPMPGSVSEWDWNEKSYLNSLQAGGLMWAAELKSLFGGGGAYGYGGPLKDFG